MIEFPCRCGHLFRVDDDQAAADVQCPDCGLLNSVPTNSDLEAIADDGTIKVGAPLPKDDPGRLGDLAYVYQKRRVDASGQEIDLRNTEEDYDGVGEFDLKPEDPPRREAPKYDPETGELIRPLEFKPDEVLDTPAAAIPLARPAIGYARPTAEAIKAVSPAMLPAALFRPINLLVMGFVLLAHVILNVSLFTVMSGIVFVFVAPLILFGLILGHYANVIDETGPQEQDELPRPLRQMSWHDDLWGPFTQVAGALILCFGPTLLALLFLPLPPVLMLPATFALGAAGAVAFPAVLLTLSTSGSVLNLRPDRVAGVMGRCGAAYPLLVLEGAAALLTYFGGFFATFLALGKGMGVAPDGPMRFFANGVVAYLLLFAGIYLSHLFSWHLGLMYRAHHPEFPWVLQRFTGSKREKAAADEAARATRRHERQQRMETMKQGRRFHAQ